MELHPTLLILFGGTAAYYAAKVAPKNHRGAVALVAGIGTAAALYSTGWFTGRDPVPPHA